MLPYSLLILVIQEVFLEHRAADGQRHVLEVAERVGEAHVVADAGVLGEQDAGAVAVRWDLGAVLAGALDEDDLADVLLVAALELDRVEAGLVGHAVDGALDGTGAEVLALQPDLGALDVLGDVGLEPGAAGVAVDAALDDEVGSIGGDGDHAVEEDGDGDRRKDAERGHGRRSPDECVPLPCECWEKDGTLFGGKGKRRVDINTG